jgi:hypothetical protein
VTRNANRNATRNADVNRLQAIRLLRRGWSVDQIADRWPDVWTVVQESGRLVLEQRYNRRTHNRPDIDRVMAMSMERVQ